MNKLDSFVIRFLMLHGMDPKKFADDKAVMNSRNIEEIRGAIVEIVNEFEISNKKDSSEYKQGVVNMGNFMLGALTKFELLNPELKGSRVVDNEVKSKRYKNGDVVKLKDNTFGYIVFDSGPTPMIPSYTTYGWLSIYEATMFLLMNQIGNGISTKLSGRYIVKRNSSNVISYLDTRDSYLTYADFSDGIILPMNGKSEDDVKMIVDACDVELSLEIKQVSRSVRTAIIKKPQWHAMSDISDYSIHFRSVVKQLISYNLFRGASEF